MRVCIVCARLSFGGAERVAVLWANGFLRKGHEVMVISNLLDPITYQLDEGIIVKNLVSTNQNKIIKWLSAFKNVRKAVNEFRPDVVIGVMATCSFVSRIATWGMGIPVIATEHDSFEKPLTAPMSKIEAFTKFRLNKIYQFVTVLTDADKIIIGDRLKHVHVLPNPLALSPLSQIPTKIKSVLAVGRLDAWHYKGLDVLIKAWGKINAHLPSCEGETWKLQIAGTGSDESLNFLKQLCKENGVEESVEFLGFRKDVEELYKQSEIFVLSSRYEGFGLVLIEAMSQGCACVACDYKGRQREIIQDDSQGLCCEPDDVNALAQALSRMMTDEAYRNSVKQNAIERSRYYSVENTTNRWEQLLWKVKSGR